MDFGSRYGFYGLGGFFWSPPMGIEGTFGSWVEISPCIKVNVYFCNISVFWHHREKLLPFLGESIFLRDILRGFLWSLGRLKEGVRKFFSYQKFWFWGPRSKILVSLKVINVHFFSRFFKLGWIFALILVQGINFVMVFWDLSNLGHFRAFLRLRSRNSFYSSNLLTKLVIFPWLRISSITF